MKTKFYFFAAFIFIIFGLILTTTAQAITVKPAIAAGGYNTVLLKEDGTVWAWGYNASGQLGNGTYKDSSTPVQVTGLTDISAVAICGGHTVALKTDGTLWTWGYNGSGQLGNGTTTDSNIPVQVTGLTNVFAIAAGGEHTIALKTDGTVWAWGYNASGQLGNGTTTDSNIPVQVTGLTNVFAIAAGGGHTIALKTDGTVWAWGSNYSGQLGNGTTTNSSTPVQVTGLTYISSIAAGPNHTVALKSDGTAWAWGPNYSGQLGNGTTIDSSTPVQVKGLTNISAIAVSSSCEGGHTVALKTEGTVWAWGYNHSGQLGNGTTTDSSIPVQITKLTDISTIAAGYDHAVALKTDGTVWTWGSNSFGQLGNGRIIYSSMLTPIQATGLTDISTIAAGYAHTVALKTDGTVWAWGDNYSGQLGNGTTMDSSTPVQVTGLTNVSAIAAGSSHTVVLKTDGTVWAWGSNWAGQLGNGTTVDSSTPVQVTSLTNISAITAGSHHTVVLKTDGTIWAWGYNHSGQLGNGTTTDSSIPVQVTELTDISAIAAGYDHTVALKTDGTVWAWGENNSGQLGNGTTMDSTTPVQVTGITDVSSIAADGFNFLVRGAHSLALKTDGTVWAWGYNYSGQLGNGTTTDSNIPIQVTGLTDIFSIAAGSSHSVVLKTDGTVWAWGDNYSGQIGNGTTTDSNIPIQVTGLTDIFSIAAGNSHTVALKQDGTVATWGNNSYGQLGDGRLLYSTTPIQAFINQDTHGATVVNAISISPSNATLTHPGEEIHFLVKGYLSSGEITTPENIKWETSDSDVVSTENGKIVAVGEGTATITASVSTSAGTLTAQAEVTVNFVPVAIEVSPVLLFLEKGKSAEPVVSVLYSDGRRKTLTDLSEYSLTATTGTDNVQINGKKITAIADGISDIEVKAKFGSSELSASLRVYVTAPVPLNITPASIRVKQSESVVVDIDGGTPPYSVSLVSPSSSSDNAGIVEQVSGQYIWRITASSKGGEYLYSISDSTGQKAVLTMTVLASLTIQFQNTTSAHLSDKTELLSAAKSVNIRSDSQRNGLEKFALKAVGGTPPFKWFNTSGEITSNPSDSSQITYIPPSAPGIYTVTVVDSGGQSQDFKVSTIVQLNTIPEKIYLAQNESGDISIFGGVSPFTVSADAGVAGKISYYPGVGVFSYTAPAVSGDYMLTVKDSAGNTVRVYAYVSPKLTVSPSKVYLRRNQTQTFQIAGGVGSDEDIDITTLQGEANNHPENMKFNYKTLGATGSDVIIITDLISGSWAKVEIEIINSDTTGDFFITPSNATLLKKESRLFKSVGGIGQEIVWKAEHGTISGQKQPSIKYTAPDIKSDTTTTPDTANTTLTNHLNTQLYAADLNTREASAGIYVIADKVLISPSQVFLKPAEHADFQGHFGTEEYKFTWTKGDGSVDETSGILTYTAPSEVGTYYITVFDSSGNGSKAEVVVRGGAKRTKIKKTDIFEIANPSPTPNSETQPAAVGNVQKGGKTFALAFDFPNYKDGKGEPVPMNFYAAAFITDMNLWVFFDEHGNIFDLNNITACMSNMTNAVYTESLKFDYCNPDSPLKVDMYILAVESKYDINNNLSFQPADAAYELWHYNFSFPKCQ